MARIRSIRPELRTSLIVAEWPREVRYFWTLLWGYLDDHGRGQDEPRLIKADCFPLDDDLSAADMDKWLDLIAQPVPGERAPLCRYEANGRRYIHATTWGDDQKPQHPKDTKIPPCPRTDCGGLSRALHEDPMKGQVEPHEGLTPEREMERGDVEGEGRGNARGATLPGTALLETFIAKATPRPPQDERQALGNEIDRLVSEQTPLDVIAEALERFHEKRRYGPSLLRRLASDVVADRAKAARGSPNGARLHHNQEATNGVLQRAMERAREADARESAAGRTQ